MAIAIAGASLSPTGGRPQQGQRRLVHLASDSCIRASLAVNKGTVAVNRQVFQADSADFWRMSATGHRTDGGLVAACREGGNDNEVILSPAETGR